MQLKDKKVLITGGSRGIGKCMIDELVKQGVQDIAVIGRDKENLKALRTTFESVNFILVRGDVGDLNVLRDVTSKIEDEWGSLDILINNAAIRPSSSFLEVTNEDWQRVINVNFMGAFWLSRACIPGMVEKGWGRIINFAGMNAIHGYNGRAHVSASKHATWGMTKALAKEFGAKGITTNIVSPGPISGQHKDPAMAAHIADMAARVPVGRLGTSEEVAATCMLLISEKGAFINGQLIQVNGGTET